MDINHPSLNDDPRRLLPTSQSDLPLEWSGLSPRARADPAGGCLVHIKFRSASLE